MTTETFEQKVKRIIDTDILANQTSLVNDLLDIPNGEFTYDNITGMSYTDEECEEQGLEEGEFKEVFQWFLVTDWLANRLDEINEPLLRNDYGQWWGRTCCGQSIELDGTIQAIIKGME
jgi:hypothetical protein